MGDFLLKLEAKIETESPFVALLHDPCRASLKRELVGNFYGHFEIKATQCLATIVHASECIEHHFIVLLTDSSEVFEWSGDDRVGCLVVELIDVLELHWRRSSLRKRFWGEDCEYDRE